MKGVPGSGVAAGSLRTRRHSIANVGPHRLERRLLNDLHEHHPYTVQHSRRVMRLAVGLGRQLNLTDEQLQVLRQVAALHDIGKLKVPVSILDGSGPLTEEQRTVVESHSDEGDRLLRAARFPASVIAAVRAVHERMDGRGYPDRLTGARIPLAARVVAVCDAFDAMASAGRNYQPRMSENDALAIIDRETGSHFDPRIVNTFREMITGTPVAVPGRSRRPAYA